MPNKDKNIPKRRFKAFENADAWELRKVGEICSISTGKSNTQDRDEQGKFPFYVRSPIIEKSTKYLFDEEAVLTVGDGVGTGKVFHYVNGKYDLHQRVYRMFSFTHVNAKYFYYYFSKKFFDRVMAMTAKNSVDSVRLEMISDMEITFPQLEEQEKIVKVLSTLDQQITLHQRKSI
ncbi:restriction endonuclease subunit S [Streptococcus suis]|uniref:restriction endonuclease subunit S n=1 Tax=Streptococcus suis TaxID=1307 RepID=UPI0029C56C32|nr:restriction endonuclease subunit S [Streptococcus suis]MDX4991943.1 restriction endonuclease subunit S [Streptococcus suis]